MAEDPRELIRSAQAAELARDLEGAIERLRRAATLYRDRGSPGQADKLLRHAERLAAAPVASNAEAPDAQSAGPEVCAPLPSGPSSCEPSPSGLLSHAPLPSGLLSYSPLTCGSGLPTATGSEDRRGQETAPTGREPQVELLGSELTFPERGPELADPSLEAWCSFCCRPSGEVGRLVTGPTGAFICVGCVAHAGASLRVGVAPEDSSSSSAQEAEVAAPLFPAHREAVAEIERAIASGARRILLLGAPGVGKARVLEALRSGGRWSAAPRTRRLLNEHELLAGGDVKTLRALEQGTFVLAAAGVLRARWAVAGAVERPLPTTVELAEATGARLPFALLEAVEAVVQVRASTEAEVLEAARRLLTEAVPQRTASERLLRALVAGAVASGRPTHELEALIRRLPPGPCELAEERS